jgi:SOS response regulatory protein OraA/RecX
MASHLAERGYDDSDVRDALDAMVRVGALDDVRYAENRARALAERGAGDTVIRHDLRGAGIADSDVHGALSALEPERDRALRVLERRGVSPRTARYLVGKGFSEDVVRGLVAHAADEGIG